MLSRLARGSKVAASSLAARPLVAAPSMFRRSFNSSPALKSTAAAAPKAGEVLSPGEIVEKYGTTTFVGMVAAILVSKELFIIDAEFLLSCEVAAFGLAAYVMTGDTVTKWSEEQDAATVKKFNGANDFAIEMFNQYKMVQSTVQNKPEVLQQYHDELKSALETNAKFETIRPQHAARVTLLQALDQIRAKEEHAAAMEWQTAVDTAVANVTKAFAANDAKLNDEMLKLAISNLGFTKPETTEANDPVKRLFMKEFKE